MMQCPYCGEWIYKGAHKCAYCRMWLRQPQAIPNPQTDSNKTHNSTPIPTSTPQSQPRPQPQHQPQQNAYRDGSASANDMQQHQYAYQSQGTQQSYNDMANTGYNENTTTTMTIYDTWNQFLDRTAKATSDSLVSFMIWALIAFTLYDYINEYLLEYLKDEHHVRLRIISLKSIFYAIFNFINDYLPGLISFVSGVCSFFVLTKLREHFKTIGVNTCISLLIFAGIIYYILTILAELGVFGEFGEIMIFFLLLIPIIVIKCIFAFQLIKSSKFVSLGIVCALAIASFFVIAIFLSLIESSNQIVWFLFIVTLLECVLWWLIKGILIQDDLDDNE